ncbi:MAG: hypothetical protein IJ996_06435, partial [Clostridia bacterium]|nr:hypothetical protein [Clostridia bacterium]
MKKTRQEKREEEARILAEMDEAMRDLRAQKEDGALQNEPKKQDETEFHSDDCMPQTMHCK